MVDATPIMVDQPPAKELAATESKTNQQASTKTRRSNTRELAKELRQRRRRSLSRKRDNLARLAIESSDTAGKSREENKESNSVLDADAASDPWCGWPLMAPERPDLSVESAITYFRSDLNALKPLAFFTQTNWNSSNDDKVEDKKKNQELSQSRQISQDDRDISPARPSMEYCENNTNSKQENHISTALSEEIEREQDFLSIANGFAISLTQYSPKAKTAISDLSHNAVRIASGLCDQASIFASKANLAVPKNPGLSTNITEEEKLTGDRQVETITSIASITSWADEQPSARLFVLFTSCQLVERWALDKSSCTSTRGKDGEKKMKQAGRSSDPSYSDKTPALISPPTLNSVGHEPQTENEQEPSWPLVYVAIALTHMFNACEKTPVDPSPDEPEASKANLTGAKKCAEVDAFSARNAEVNDFEGSNKCNHESSEPMDQREREGEKAFDSQNPELKKTFLKGQKKSSLLEEKLRRWARPKRSSLLPNPHLNDGERLLDIHDNVSSLSELSDFEKAGNQTKTSPWDEQREDDSNDDGRASDLGTPLRFSC